MTRLYFIRHAEAEGNVYRRAHGQYNSLLTPNGHRQLKRLAEWFRTRSVDAVYASDLFRTQTTAKAVADLFGLSVVPVKALREISLGEWEDLPWGEIGYRQGEMLSRFIRNEDFHIPGGEDYPTVFKRFSGAVDEIVRRHEGQSVVITAHGCVIKFFLDSIADKPLPHLDNASVSLVRVENGTSRIEFAGENAFLGELSTFAGQTWWRVQGNRDSEFWFKPVAFPEETEQVCRYGFDCWHSVYQTEKGFDEAFFQKTCRKAAGQNPRFAQLVMDEDTPIGFFQMQPHGGISSQDGHISMVYLEEKYRGKGFGVQLLGEAISLARAQGKPGVSLRVWESNHSALRFYEKAGFVPIGKEDGMFGPLLLMRKNIRVDGL